MRHDLRPYSCTYSNCDAADRLFDSRHEWASHEKFTHRRVYKCAEHPDHEFDELGYVAHTESFHSKYVDQMTSAYGLQAATSTGKSIDRGCPLCFISMASLEDMEAHLIYHLECVALLSLPRATGLEKGSQQGDAASAEIVQGTDSRFNDSQLALLTEDEPDLHVHPTSPATTGSGILSEIVLREKVDTTDYSMNVLRDWVHDHGLVSGGSSNLTHDDAIAPVEAEASQNSDVGFSVTDFNLSHWMHHIFAYLSSKTSKTRLDLGAFGATSTFDSQIAMVPPQKCVAAFRFPSELDLDINEELESYFIRCWRSPIGQVNPSPEGFQADIGDLSVHHLSTWVRLESSIGRGFQVDLNFAYYEDLAVFYCMARFLSLQKLDDSPMHGEHLLFEARITERGVSDTLKIFQYRESTTLRFQACRRGWIYFAPSSSSSNGLGLWDGRSPCLLLKKPCELTFNKHYIPVLTKDGFQELQMDVPDIVHLISILDRFKTEEAVYWSDDAGTESDLERYDVTSSSQQEGGHVKAKAHNLSEENSDWPSEKEYAGLKSVLQFRISAMGRPSFAQGFLDSLEKSRDIVDKLNTKASIVPHETYLGISMMESNLRRMGAKILRSMNKLDEQSVSGALEGDAEAWTNFVELTDHLNRTLLKQLTLLRDHNISFNEFNDRIHAQYCSELEASVLEAIEAFNQRRRTKESASNTALHADDGILASSNPAKPGVQWVRPAEAARSSSPRVGFSTTVRSMRPPRDDELAVMHVFARHAAHCIQCDDPYLVWRTDGELCNRGNAYARDVAKYIYSKGGRPHSVIDKETKHERNEIEIPIGCEVIRNLTKAFHQGLNLRSRKPRVLYDGTYYVPDRTSKEKTRYRESSSGPYGIEITPSGQKESGKYPRQARGDRDRKRASITVGKGGSLYDLDEAAKLSRRRYEDDPVVIIAEPDGRARYVR